MADYEGYSSREEEVAAMFAACDQDGDGYIDNSELANLFIQLGFEDNDGDNFQKYIQECAPSSWFDEDQNEVLDYEEFVRLYNYLLDGADQSAEAVADQSAEAVAE
jgi:Ca2+-binding EF-hand superfamily protein